MSLSKLDLIHTEGAEAKQGKGDDDLCLHVASSYIEVTNKKVSRFDFDVDPTPIQIDLSKKHRLTALGKN